MPSYQYADAAQTRVRVTEDNGMVREVSAAGFAVMFSDEDVTPPSIAPFSPPEISIEAWRADLNIAVDRQADALRLALVGTDSKTQLEVYRNKYERAQAGDLDFLADEATARGVSAEQLAALIIAKGDEWRVGGQLIETAKGAHKTAIAALADAAAAEAYDITTGWPA